MEIERQNEERRKARLEEIRTLSRRSVVTGLSNETSSRGLSSSPSLTSASSQSSSVLPTNLSWKSKEITDSENNQISSAPTESILTPSIPTVTYTSPSQSSKSTLRDDTPPEHSTTVYASNSFKSSPPKPENLSYSTSSRSESLKALSKLEEAEKELSEKLKRLTERRNTLRSQTSMDLKSTNPNNNPATTNRDKLDNISTVVMNANSQPNPVKAPPEKQRPETSAQTDPISPTNSVTSRDRSVTIDATSSRLHRYSLPANSVRPTSELNSNPTILKIPSFVSNRDRRATIDSNFANDLKAVMSPQPQRSGSSP